MPEGKKQLQDRCVTAAPQGSPRSWLYSEWRATQNKTTNSYVIEIAI
jgi:hypothetical protein